MNLFILISQLFIFPLNILELFLKSLLNFIRLLISCTWSNLNLLWSNSNGALNTVYHSRFDFVSKLVFYFINILAVSVDLFGVWYLLDIFAWLLVDASDELECFHELLAWNFFFAARFVVFIVSGFNFWYVGILSLSLSRDRFHSHTYDILAFANDNLSRQINMPIFIHLKSNCFNTLINKFSQI